jgi:uncharacterized protein YfdQ (DUF2303 family)
MDPIKHSENAAVIDLVSRIGDASLVEVDGKAVAVSTPTGRQLHQIKQFTDALLELPERRKGTASLTDLNSFIDHTLRFAHPDRSAIFAHIPTESDGKPELRAVLDYHDKGADSTARWCQHVARYSFPISEEWRRWIGNAKKAMSQADFAEFIEANILDVLPPESAGESAKDWAQRSGVAFATPQRLMDASRNLVIKVTDRVQQAITLASGECQVQYSSTHSDEAGAPVKVPGAFLIGLPVFRNGDHFQLAARLRYRLREGVVSWWYELHRADRVLEFAIQESARKAAEATALPLFYGKPEGG